ncbi:MAG: inositol monophosphatase family protein [Planctomycetota bacterium]
MNNDQRLDLAVQAVVRAAEVCEAVRKQLVAGDKHDKGDRSPVTVADFASQAVIAQVLAEAELPIVAEESVAELDEASEDLRTKAAEASGMSADDLRKHVAMGGGEPTGTYWVLDPIDGTKGFLRGGQYAIALALIENGRPTMGLLGCPRWDIGRLFAAAEGDAWTASLSRAESHQPITAAGTNETIRLTESVESGHADHDLSTRLAEAIGVTEEPLRMDSQAKYAAVASGEADVYLRVSPGKTYREKVWDHAAGVAVVEAAGGRVTDATGKPLDFTASRKLDNNTGIVATGGPQSLHDRVVAALKSSM